MVLPLVIVVATFMVIHKEPAEEILKLKAGNTCKPAAEGAAIVASKVLVENDEVGL